MFEKLCKDILCQISGYLTIEGIAEGGILELFINTEGRIDWNEYEDELWLKYYSKEELLRNFECDLFTKKTICAAKYGRLDMIKWLYETGNPKTVDDAMKIAIREAMYNNHIDIVEFLTEKDYKFDDGLRIATYIGNLEMIKYLLSKGYKISQSVMNNVVKYSYLEGIKFLCCNIKKEHKINMEEVMYNAIIHGSDEIVKFFCSKGIKISKKDGLYMRDYNRKLYTSIIHSNLNTIKP
jgi:hypothetical protein